jgi:hypothetical protein
MTRESLINYMVSYLSKYEKDNQHIEAMIRKMFEYKDKHLTKDEIEEDKQN